tara:strand:- start:1222 stop:1587 length:366 start_codon:yes stop_codon:yes gene_type:complete
MRKFIKLTHSDMDFIFPINEILSVKAPTGSTGAASNATQVHILLKNGFGLTDASDSEVPVIKISASGADTDDKVKAQLNALIAEIGNALETSWTNPIYAVTLPHAITAIAHDQALFRQGTI